jgi:hypothetical protein
MGAGSRLPDGVENGAIHPSKTPSLTPKNPYVTVASELLLVDRHEVLGA